MVGVVASGQVGDEACAGDGAVAGPERLLSACGVIREEVQLSAHGDEVGRIESIRSSAGRLQRDCSRDRTVCCPELRFRAVLDHEVDMAAGAG